MLGHVPTQVAVQKLVLRQGADPLLAAQDVGDAHQVVVHHDREVIGREPVALQEHLHVHLGPRNLDRAAQPVVYPADAFTGNAQADHVRLAGADAAFALRVGQAEAVPVVTRVLAALALRAAHGVEPLAGAETAERVALRHEALGVLPVQRHPLALPVGSVVATDIRTLVPIDPGPAQRGDDGRLGLGAGPRLVRVLDAQDETPAMAAREGEIEERDVRGAHVRIARGRRRDAGADGQAGIRHGGAKL